MTQKARSRLDRVRRNRRPTVAARTAKVAPAATTAAAGGMPTDGPAASHQTAGEQRDHCDAWSGEADERVGRRPERQGQRRAAEGDHHGVDVRPQGVAPEVHEDVAPGVQGRLEVDERQVDGPLLT